MTTHIIDYSREFFSDDVPNKNKTVKRSGKFVVLQNSNEQWIVFAPKEMVTFHAQIVERFFLSRGVVGDYNSKRDSYRIISDDWYIDGGGFWEIDSETDSLILSGSSAAYGPANLRAVAREDILKKEMKVSRIMLI